MAWESYNGKPQITKQNVTVGSYSLGLLYRKGFRFALESFKMAGWAINWTEYKGLLDSDFAVKAPFEVYRRLCEACKKLAEDTE